MNRQAHKVFEEAIELRGAEREAYIRAACQENHDIESEVRSLLDAHHQAGEFLIAPTADITGATPQPQPALSEKTGTIIDRYKLLECIGEGGFGVVYMAQQSQPVRRRVALKVIKLGMDTHQVVARFEAERQALAMMDHPNIAGVFDGGATDSGRPYFVMELVRGEPITQYCDRARLSTKQRLELFQQVCRAIQHAHQKGIIHRDIKPNNVLVTVSDARPLVKVIDFGIAKATNQELTEKTMFTEFRQIIGTPQYMSPEQAESTGIDVDTRTDVYSLGVLLYEMLAGRTPIDPQKLQSIGWNELQRVICDEEPTKPSALVSTKIKDPARIAQLRDTEPARLGGLLKGDLDWIMLKALEKDRSRRYDSASGLANDIQRYLDDEPVEATPPSVRYRFEKFARRNRSLLAGTGAVLATLILGVIGTTVMAIRANASRDDAEHARTQAETALVKARRASVLAGASLTLPESEARDLARAWQQDLNQQRERGNVDQKSLATEEASFAAWYGNWLWANGNAKEATETIQPYFERAKKELGTDHSGFLSVCNAYVLALVRAEAEPIRIARAYDVLLESITKVHGEDAGVKLMPECAAAFVKANQPAKATEMIETYLRYRSEIGTPLDAVDNLRLDAAIDQMALWGEKQPELYNAMKRLRETGLSLAANESDKDPELAQDMKQLQGRWSWRRFEDGNEAEHMVIHFEDQRCTTTWLDTKGKTIKARATRIELSRSGGVKVLKAFLPGAIDYGAFIYRLDPKQLVLVRGMLANEPSLSGTDRQVFLRVEE